MLKKKKWGKEKGVVLEKRKVQERAQVTVCGLLPPSQNRFIRSLSRCVKFDAKGGKSRSTFCKVIGKLALPLH